MGACFLGDIFASWALLSGKTMGRYAGKVPSSAWRGFGLWCHRQCAHSLPSWLHLRPNFSFSSLPAACSSPASAPRGASRRQAGCSIPTGAMGPPVLCSLCLSLDEALLKSIQKSLHFCSFFVPSLGHWRSHSPAGSLGASPAPSGSVDLTLIGL